MQKHYSAFIVYKNKNIEVFKEICTKVCSTANQNKIWNHQRDSKHGKRTALQFMNVVAILTSQ